MNSLKSCTVPSRSTRTATVSPPAGSPSTPMHRPEISIRPSAASQWMSRVSTAISPTTCTGRQTPTGAGAPEYAEERPNSVVRAQRIPCWATRFERQRPRGRRFLSHRVSEPKRMAISCSPAGTGTSTGRNMDSTSATGCPSTKMDAGNVSPAKWIRTGRVALTDANIHQSASSMSVPWGARRASHPACRATTPSVPSGMDVPCLDCGIAAGSSNSSAAVATIRQSVSTLTPPRPKPGPVPSPTTPTSRPSRRRRRPSCREPPSPV